MKNYNTNNSHYNDLKTKLAQQAENNRILHVYTPGTGATATDRLSIKEALDKVTESAPASFARIDLDGVGSDSIIAPAHRNTYSLELTAKSFKEKAANLLLTPFVSTSRSEVDVDPLVNLTDKGTEINGIVTGSGEKQNNQLVLNTLAALEKDKLLPTTLVLVGHSRGAVSSIQLANEIYRQYGDRIKLDLVLTDPVPGPFHWHVWDKMVIPPNVRSAAIFYAKDEDGLFSSPLDLRKLVLSNPETTVTACALEHSHISIASSDYVVCQAAKIIAGLNNIDVARSVEEYQQEKRSRLNQFAFEKKILEQQKQAIESKEINDLTEQDLTTLSSAEKNIASCNWLIAHYEMNAKKPNPEQQKSAPSNSSRKYCRYAGVTTRHRDLPDAAWQAHNAIRGDFIQGYGDSHPKNGAYQGESCLIGKSEEARRYQLRDAYHKGKPYQVSYGELAAYLLIIPTLGLSANIYCARQKLNMSHRLLSFASGIGTLNIAPAAQMLVQTTGKLLHNCRHGGFFRPPARHDYTSMAALAKIDTAETSAPTTESNNDNSSITAPLLSKF